VRAFGKSSCFDRVNKLAGRRSGLVVKDSCSTTWGILGFGILGYIVEAADIDSSLATVVAKSKTRSNC
jgi:hypothetical protein